MIFRVCFWFSSKAKKFIILLELLYLLQPHFTILLNKRLRNLESAKTVYLEAEVVDLTFELLKKIFNFSVSYREQLINFDQNCQ